MVNVTLNLCVGCWPERILHEKFLIFARPGAGSKHWYLTWLPLEREGALYRAGMQDLDKGTCQINEWVLIFFWVLFFSEGMNVKSYNFFKPTSFVSEVLLPRNIYKKTEMLYILCMEESCKHFCHKATVNCKLYCGIWKQIPNHPEEPRKCHILYEIEALRPSRERWKAVEFFHFPSCWPHEGDLSVLVWLFI